MEQIPEIRGVTDQQVQPRGRFGKKGKNDDRRHPPSWAEKGRRADSIGRGSDRGQRQVAGRGAVPAPPVLRRQPHLSSGLHRATGSQVRRQAGGRFRVQLRQLAGFGRWQGHAPGRDQGDPDQRRHRCARPRSERLRPRLSETAHQRVAGTGGRHADQGPEPGHRVQSLALQRAGGAEPTVLPVRNQRGLLGTGT